MTTKKTKKIPRNHWSKILERERKARENKVRIVSRGLLFIQSGFGEALRNIILGLDSHGCLIKAVSAAPWDVDNVGVNADDKINRVLELQNSNIPQSDCPIHLTMLDPPGIRDHPGHYNIAYIMFETEKFPKDFVHHLRNQDEIWTPSKFCKKTMIKAGLKNVHIMPLGVDIERFNPDIVTPMERPDDLKDKFMFLIVCGWSERKGIDVLMRAFAEEFDKDEDVCLYMKGGWYDKKKAEASVQKYIGDIIHTAPPIKLDFKIYSCQDLPRIYKMADCYTMPTRGEGWGLEFSEAMAMEMPIIGTNWSGNTEFMNEDNSYLLDYDGLKTCPEIDWIIPHYIDAKFANPDKEHLKKLMRHVFENQKEAKAKGEYARKFISEKYTWKKSTKKAFNRLKKIHKMLKEKGSK